MDCGDYVVVTNCSHINVTGKKMEQKTYWRHSGKPGNLKLTNMETLIAQKGAKEVVRKAVSGMLPRNKLRKWRLARLKLFDGSDHPYKQNLIAFHDEQPIVKDKIKRIEAKKAQGFVDSVD